MSGLIKLGLAAAGGYALGRYLEGLAQGVPAAELFKLDTILTPVSQLRAPRATQQLPQPVTQVVNAALAPLYPWGFAGVEGDDY